MFYLYYDKITVKLLDFSLNIWKKFQLILYNILGNVLAKENSFETKKYLLNYNALKNVTMHIAQNDLET